MPLDHLEPGEEEEEREAEVREEGDLGADLGYPELYDGARAEEITAADDDED